MSGNDSASMHMGLCGVWGFGRGKGSGVGFKKRAGYKSSTPNELVVM